MSAALEQLYSEIELHLTKIESLLPETYKISFLARCTRDDLDDADILLTLDTLPNIQKAIEKRVKSEGDKKTHYGNIRDITKESK